MVRVPFRSTTAACVFALTLVLGACQSTPRLSVGTTEITKASLDALVASAPSDRRAAAADAAKRFVAAYLSASSGPSRTCSVHGEDVDCSSALPDIHAVNGMTLEQFLHFSQAFLSPKPTLEAPRTTLADVPYLRTEYRASLVLAKTLLERAQTQAHKDQMFTQDQFKWGPVTIRRPWDSSELSSDYTEFEIPFVNETGFDIYRPTFQFTFLSADTRYPIYQRELQWGTMQAIAPNAPTTLRLTCCSSGENGQTHKVLHSMAPDTIVRVEIVRMLDSMGRSVLDGKHFTSNGFHQLQHVNACLADLDAKGEAWAPEDADEQCRAIAESAPPREFALGDARR